MPTIDGHLEGNAKSRIVALKRRYLGRRTSQRLSVNNGGVDLVDAKAAACRGRIAVEIDARDCYARAAVERTASRVERGNVYGRRHG